MPPTPAKDTTAPLVIATKPSSEQVGININDFIEVTFNEAIANVDTNQVSIYPYDTNHSISKIRINLQPTPFLYDPNTKTLTIRPELNSLKAATKYRVVIRAVKDKVGNVMVGACEWDFGTAGLPNFGLGKRGICETSITVAKDPTAPNEPQKVRAVAGDSSVTVTWQAAISGTEVTYYKIEKSVNSGQSFELVVGNVPSSKLIYTDLTAQNGISHIYRVIAGSSNGLFSNSVNSNLVTPVAIQVAMTPSVPENVKAVAGDGVVTVSWAAPSTGDSVTYYRIEKSVDSAAYKLVQDKILATTFRYIDTPAQNGVTHVYKVFAGNTVGLGQMTLTSVVTPQAVIVTLPRELLISPSRSLNNEFGRSFAFSPDGTVLVIGEPRASQGALGISAGSVHLFVKSNGKWGKAQSLASQPPIKSGDYFGYSVDVSKDGMTIAIGGLFSGKVDLYTKSGTGSWLFLQNLQADGTTAVRFGTSVSFHRSNALLAVGDYLANPNNVSNAGVVQLFKKSANKWVFSQQLTAKSQAASNFFGSDFIFSPDGNSLAVSESGGDLAAIDGGVVHLFVFNGIDWSFSQELTSSSAGTNFFFGGSTVRKKAIDFSFDSTTIAIGEGGSNTVQLFTLSAGTWNPGPVLSVTTATGGLGSSVSYSADGSTLAAGEPYATIDGVPNAGTVRLFRKNGVNWSANGIVSALVPTAGNYFGYTLLFSPVSNELAVFEYYGDTVNVKDAGVVSIIDISQLP